MKINLKARQKARSYLLQALYQWKITGQSITEIEAQFLLTFEGKKVDVGYFQECFKDIIQQLDTLDAHYTPFLGIDFEKIDPVELSVLRLATYELQCRPEIPYKVIINEALELAKTFGSVDGFKFINGVIDKTAKKLRKEESGL